MKFYTKKCRAVLVDPIEIAIYRSGCIMYIDARTKDVIRNPWIDTTDFEDACVNTAFLTPDGVDSYSETFESPIENTYTVIERDSVRVYASRDMAKILECEAVIAKHKMKL